MLILVLLILLPAALCVSVLMCTILVGQLNKIFGLITQTINILHGIYYMESIAWSSKICAFGVTLSPSLCQVFMDAATKATASLILSQVG